MPLCQKPDLGRFGFLYAVTCFMYDVVGLELTGCLNCERFATTDASFFDYCNSLLVGL